MTTGSECTSIRRDFIVIETDVILAVPDEQLHREGQELK
jgi:hypothetical protein